MKIVSTLLLIAAALTQSARADSLSFDFKDPKGVNNVVFKTDAPLESTNGTANGISGSITCDPASLTDVKGKITVAADSLRVPNPMMLEHLQSDKWLDVKTYPEITFEIRSVNNLKKDGDTATADVTGTFTLKGMSKDITVPVKVTYLPGKLADRSMGKMQGDLLVIRAHFQIKRTDFNIQPGQFLDKVSDDIDLSLSIAGAAPKS